MTVTHNGVESGNGVLSVEEAVLMIRHSMLVVGLALGLAACASPEALQRSEEQRSVYPPDVFGHRVATSHVVLYWNCSRPESNVQRLDGVAQNPWSPQEVRFLELELVGVDARDRAISETKGEIPDFLLRTNQTSPFHLDLRTVGGEVRFDLYYRYRFQDGEMEALLAGPPVRGPRLLAQVNQFLARDVCSDTQHRAR